MRPKIQVEEKSIISVRHTRSVTTEFVKGSQYFYDSEINPELFTRWIINYSIYIEEE
jgi:hypothetical protein